MSDEVKLRTDGLVVAKVDVDILLRDHEELIESHDKIVNVSINLQRICDELVAINTELVEALKHAKTLTEEACKEFIDETLAKHGGEK